MHRCVLPRTSTPNWVPYTSYLTLYPFWCITPHMAQTRVEFLIPEDDLREAKIALLQGGYRDLSSVIRWLLAEWVKSERSKVHGDDW